MLIIGCDFHTSYQQFSSGNMTNDGLNTMVGACPERSRRDAENHVTSATSGSGTGTYTYDGSGQRVKKIGGGNTIVTIFAGAQVLAEYYNGAAPSSPTDEYIYAGSMKIASIQSGTTNYWHNDHLSPRVRTDTSGNVSDQRATFPFGETWYSPGASPYMFTSYYRDYEASGNDYAQARYNVSGLGRFSSPDPISGSTSDPQSLNRYSYVRNMPVMLTDPFGTCPGGTAQNRDDNQSQDSQGGGPYASDSSDTSDPDPQQGPPPWSGCKGFTDQGGGASGPDTSTLDWMDIGQLPGGLIGNGDSNDTAVVPLGDSLGFNPWIADPFGRGWQNPSNGCVIGLGSGDIYCGGPGDGGSEGFYENSELDLFSLGGPGSTSHLVPFINMSNLFQCAKTLYSINVATAVPAEPGQNGTFLGFGKSGQQVNVETDVASYSSAALTLLSFPKIASVSGATFARNPNLNYIANNLSPSEMYPVTWVHELGHSLDLITTGTSSEKSADAFANCVLK